MKLFLYGSIFKNGNLLAEIESGYIFTSLVYELVRQIFLTHSKLDFKFKLHKLERKLISIQLNVKDEQIPLKISINARKRMAIWYKAGNKLLMRGKPQFVKFLDAKNKDNELTISINDKNWVILINGNDISTKFGNTLEHNSQYKSVLEVI